jgi:hypothetical protein
MAADLDHLSPKARALYQALVAADIGAPLTFTSGYRDPEHNARVGGAKGSRHVHGDALDISTANLSDEQRTALLRAAVAAGARGVGIYPSGAIHVDVRDTPAFWGTGGSYRGQPIDSAPAYARPVLAELFSGKVPAAPAPGAGPRPAVVQSSGQPLPGVARYQAATGQAAPAPAPAAVAAGPALAPVPEQSTFQRMLGSMASAFSKGGAAGGVMGAMANGIAGAIPTAALMPAQQVDPLQGVRSVDLTSAATAVAPGQVESGQLSTQLGDIIGSIGTVGRNRTVA